MSSVSPDFAAVGVKGPLFISIGDDAKLRKFQEMVPEVPLSSLFADGYDCSAYTAVGFGTITAEGGRAAVKDGRGARAPDLGPGGFWKYIKSVGALSPVNSEGKFQQGSVLQNGGTFVVEGDKLLFAWADRVPGDFPAADVVLQAVTAGKQQRY
jgi:hypothetical protein